MKTNLEYLESLHREGVASLRTLAVLLFIGELGPTGSRSWASLQVMEGDGLIKLGGVRDERGFVTHISNAQLTEKGWKIVQGWHERFIANAGGKS